MVGMKILTGTRIFVFTICSALLVHAAASDVMTQGRKAAIQSPEEVKQQMKMDEPMQGGMKKKGMLKGDVKASAEKKDKKMQEMLKKEEQAMPPQSREEQ